MGKVRLTLNKKTNSKICYLPSIEQIDYIFPLILVSALLLLIYTV